MLQSNNGNDNDGVSAPCDQSNTADAPPLTSSETAVPVVPPRNNEHVDNPQVILRSIAVTDVEQVGDDDNSQGKFSDSEGGNEVRKRRTSPVSTETGVEHVNEQAPQLNRRFYLGLDRASVRARTARARQNRARRRRGRQAADTATDNAESQSQENNEGDNGQSEGRNGRGTPTAENSRRRSGLFRMVSSLMSADVSNPENLVMATLVEENEGDVVVGERVRSFERHWKKIAFVLCSLLIIMGVVIAVLTHEVTELENTDTPTISPSMQPTSPPSFVPGPTLEKVQKRGVVQCGLWNSTITGRSSLRYDLCRAVAAVLFGNASNIEPVLVTSTNRFQLLNDRKVDMLLGGDTHTIRREVSEESTGVGFTFSSTYFYDGMSYLGNQTFVSCAENQQRYTPCNSLRICVLNETTHHEFVESMFPSDFFTVVSSFDDMTGLLNNTCNVIARARSSLLEFRSTDENGGNYDLGNETVTTEPLAIVTRNNDREFSDIINWIVQAIFYGEEQGLVNNTSLCRNYTNLTSVGVSDLHFLNAVYCVGSYGQLSDLEMDDLGMNSINNGSTGMLYTIPFGEMEGDDDFGHADTSASGLSSIRHQNSLNCGVVVPDDFDGNITNSSKLVGISVDYCRTLAAALFNGQGGNETVNFTTFSGNSSTSFSALNNGTIDVLAGARVEQKYDFESSSSLKGSHFSTPYYYGNETTGEDVTFFSLATREDDALFSSFVNTIVVATIYAQENNIDKKRFNKMPLIPLFGSEFQWALRDAIYYVGSYDQIYARNFVNVAKEDRGRNILNNKGKPQIHSFPGLTHDQ